MTALVLRGDAAHLPLPDASVDLLLCSPPYFGQRDYRDGGESLAGQIGSEETPAEYTAALLRCTREWMRVLKPEGSIFVNLGDSYYSGKGAPGKTTTDPKNAGRNARRTTRSPLDYGLDLPRKTLIGLPARYMIGCIDDLGLIVRRDIIWHKTSAQPESVTDRCATRHEYLFHLVKQPRYFTAVDEIREESQADHHTLSRRDRTDRRLAAANAGQTSAANPLGKLPGSVWEIAATPLVVPPRIAHARCCQGFPKPGCEGLAHHAAFPLGLPRRCILGWSPSGICLECGEGRRPKAESVALDLSRPQARRAQQLADRAGLTEAHLAALLSVGVSDTGRGAATQSGTGRNAAEVYVLAAEARAALGGYAREYLLRRPTGFVYVCDCSEPTAPIRPAVVADPLGGTGTTALLAASLGRIGITVDLSADYCHLARWRTTDPAERARALGVPKPPPVSEGQGSLFDQEAS